MNIAQRDKVLETIIEVQNLTPSALVRYEYGSYGDSPTLPDVSCCVIGAMLLAAGVPPVAMHDSGLTINGDKMPLALLPMDSDVLVYGGVNALRLTSALYRIPYVTLLGAQRDFDFAGEGNASPSERLRTFAVELVRSLPLTEE